MKKVIFIFFLVIHSISGKSQSFCDTMFERDFQFEYKISDSNYYNFKFEEDTIDFYKGKEMSYFVNLHLNCNDSSFFFSLAHSNIKKINEGISEDGDEIIISSFNSGEDYGIWKYNSIANIISFKMVNSEKWYPFKINQKGSQDDNPFFTLTGNRDYRYLIRLIAIKEEIK